MNYNPNIHHRQSIRLKGYDYSQAGLYFVTLCLYGRACLFGHIENAEMILNDSGRTAQQCWLDIPNHYPNVVLHEYVIMPNHVHGIVQIVDDGGYGECRGVCKGEIFFAPAVDPTDEQMVIRGTSRTIGSMLRGFKIGVTKWMRQNTNVQNIWQRNYYEHIIRNEQSYQNIAEYIVDNPVKWKDDKFYVG
ncbi:transposase [Acetobacteroides hydrogenigenes]|uniref:REP element-mobilizing transposase RayT n=1 Tax=Acetobacteroides hydrogenigenes TaxID=979970 RepID=A0A4R2EBU0_9BACT|nr:transposase [Acetobacteroides hydrogenigenes]TCN65405.1 REP element-mobilizing transposase RayT [Acetobacteroides hydrogenigenes]